MHFIFDRNSLLSLIFHLNVIDFLHLKQLFFSADVIRAVWAGKLNISQ